MPVSQALHNLLLTLSQAEKRYLRLYMERHRKVESNRCVAMLDLMLGAAIYDEGKIKQIWANLGWDVKQFAYAKHYLYDLTLQAMRDFHRNQSIRSTVEDLLTDAEFLYRRGLLGEASKYVNKVRKLAQEHDLPSLVLAADSLGRTLALRTPIDEAPAAIADLEESSSKAQALQDLILETQQLHGRLTILARQLFNMRDSQGKADLEAFQDSPFLRDALESSSFTPRMTALRCKVLMAQLDGDREAIWEWQQLLMVHWQGHPKMQKELSPLYLITLVNHLAFCQITTRFEELNKTVLLLEGLELHTPLERIEATHNIAYYGLLLAMNLSDWPLVSDRAEKLESVAELYEKWIPKARLIAIQYNVAIAYFFLEMPKQALTAFNNILNDERTQHRIDIQQAARILQAVTHYELGNHDLLDYLLRNLKRHLQVNNALYAFEASLLKALRELLARPDDRDGILQKLKEKLLALKDDPENAHAPGLEEMQHWVEAKLQGRPIREMLGTPPKA